MANFLIHIDNDVVDKCRIILDYKAYKNQVCNLFDYFNREKHVAETISIEHIRFAYPAIYDVHKREFAYPDIDIRVIQDMRSRLFSEVALAVRSYDTAYMITEILSEGYEWFALSAHEAYCSIDDCLKWYSEKTGIDISQISHVNFDPERNMSPYDHVVLAKLTNNEAMRFRLEDEYKLTTLHNKLGVMEIPLKFKLKKGTP